MKLFVKNTENQPTKRAEKKSINTRWNSRLYFQIGLIVSIILATLAMEITYEVGPKNDAPFGISLIEDPGVIDYVLDLPEKKTVAIVKKPAVKPPVKKQVVLTNVKPIDNFTSVDGPDIAPTDVPVVDTNLPTTHTTTTSKPPVDYGPTNVVNVEHVPVFPGCESLGTNKAKIDCMSSKIATFVNRKFRTDDFDDLSGDPIQKIYVQFTIDKSGHVTDVRANSKHDELEKEAQRVIAKLPSMQPGKQGDVSVDVIYVVPISLQIKY